MCKRLRVYKVRPVNSDLECSVSCKVTSSSVQRTSKYASTFEWRISPLAHLCSQNAGDSEDFSPCVALLEHNDGSRTSLSCVISAVGLLSPQQYTNVAKAQDIAKIKEGVPARLKFLKWVFDQLGIKGGVDAAVSLSLSYLICRSKEVGGIL